MSGFRTLQELEHEFGSPVSITKTSAVFPMIHGKLECTFDPQSKQLKSWLYDPWRIGLFAEAESVTSRIQPDSQQQTPSGPLPMTGWHILDGKEAPVSLSPEHCVWMERVEVELKPVPGGVRMRMPESVAESLTDQLKQRSKVVFYLLLGNEIQAKSAPWDPKQPQILIFPVPKTESDDVVWTPEKWCTHLFTRMKDVMKVVKASGDQKP